ncbi:MAG: L,D-transpeptidase family protein [Chloroflexota bacterium]|nr:L,D-transpeptidase family protein [Chloroflexota bacterium]
MTTNPNKNQPSRLSPPIRTTVRLGRRHFVSGAVAGGLLLPFRDAVAQTSPPIEQRGDEPLDEGFDVIEPELEPTISPEEDSGTITDIVEGEGVRYFAQTGHNLDEPFLSPWMLAGGEGGPGFPISEPRLVGEDGTIRQDFEAFALVYDPNVEADRALRAVPLPDSVVNGIATGEAATKVLACRSDQVSCQFFAATGHTVSGAFGTFWAEHGGQQLIGLPRSEMATSGGMTVQVFDHVVLEMDSSQQVTMRRVNTDLAMQSAAGDDPAFLPAPPTLGTTWLVAASDGLRLRSGPNVDAEVIAVLPDSAEFIAANGGDSGWVPGYVDGFSGWVAAEFLSTREALAAVDTANWRLDVWDGLTLSDSNIRHEPTTASQSVRTIPYQSPVVIVDWVRGEPVVDNQITWAQLEDGSYVYARNLGRAAPVAPPALGNDAPREGKWIDVHLTQQLMVAYEGRTPVRTVVTTTGMPGWETPPGFYSINTRVANETMESGSIGAEDFYVLKNVLFTQYFTDRGHALHYAWWKTAETIGRPGSHGCLNLLLEDAQFFWDWATIGTPVVCRVT